jgi:Carboxypeptidase regulatory-like domain
MNHHKIVAQRTTQPTTQWPDRQCAAQGSIAGSLAILITVLSITGLSSPSVPADDGTTRPAAAKPKAADAPPSSAPAPALFELRIVGPDDKPVPDARVTLLMSPRPNDVRVRAGTLVNKSRNNLLLQSDANGRVAIERPARLDYLNYQIRKPGYGYYWNWLNLQNKAEADLAPKTARLQRAWTIGGLIVDSGGKPIPNVRILLQLQMSGGQTVFSDRLWSNSKGVWKFENVPESMQAVTAQISDAKFVPETPTLDRAEFGVEPGHEPTATITLKPGWIVTGTVTDDGGKPIAKARVGTMVNNDARSAFTDKKGQYRLEGCGPGNTQLVASAKGRAPDLKSVNIGPNLGPVDFSLKPGNTIRVRILDEAGRPVPKGTVFIQQWREQYVQFDRVPRETDVDALWEWNEAPADEVTASIGRPNGMTLGNRPLSPRKEEFVFRVPSALVISGKVIDAETHQPITGFRAVSGYVWMGQQVIWQQGQNPRRTGSTYEVRKTYDSGVSLVRVEADGYMPAVSREIGSEEGKVTIDFELLKGKTIAATVLTPDGAPAARAKVAIPAPGEQVMIVRGELQDQGGNGNLVGIMGGLFRQFRPAGRVALAAVHETDKEGKFRVEAKNTNCSIVVTHPTGYAELSGMPNSNPRTLKLKPWARIEGTFQAARKPVAHAQMVDFRNQFFFGQNEPRIISQSTQSTDARGRFAFDRIIPGQHTVSFQTDRADDAETASSVTISANCPAGKTTHVEFGTNGRPLIGQLRKPSNAKADLQLSSIQIYINQEGGDRWGQSQLTFNARADRDGNFAIDDVPPGNYFLSAFVPGQQAVQIQQHRFVVPKVNEKLWQRPVDLGVLTMSTPEAPRARRVRVAR